MHRCAHPRCRVLAQSRNRSTRHGNPTDLNSTAFPHTDIGLSSFHCAYKDRRPGVRKKWPKTRWIGLLPRVSHVLLSCWHRRLLVQGLGLLEVHGQRRQNQHYSSDCGKGLGPYLGLLVRGGIAERSLNCYWFFGLRNWEEDVTRVGTSILDSPVRDLLEVELPIEVITNTAKVNAEPSLNWSIVDSLWSEFSCL